jgi:TRAP-type C4-dicarboxylate transport system permease large subunit
MVRIDTGLMMAQYSQNIVAFCTDIYNNSCAGLSVPPSMYFIVYAQQDGAFGI